MTEPSQPDWVRAWAIALECEVYLMYDRWYYKAKDGFSLFVPDCDSGNYFKAMVLAVLNGSKTLYFAPNWPMKGTYEVLIGDYRETKPDQEVVGHGPDQVSALIAAISASKGGEK